MENTEEEAIRNQRLFNMSGNSYDAKKLVEQSQKSITHDLTLSKYKKEEKKISKKENMKTENEVTENKQAEKEEPQPKTTIPEIVEGYGLENICNSSYITSLLQALNPLDDFTALMDDLNELLNKEQEKSFEQLGFIKCYIDFNVGWLINAFNATRIPHKGMVLTFDFIAAVNYYVFKGQSEENRHPIDVFKF